MNSNTKRRSTFKGANQSILQAMGILAVLCFIMLGACGGGSSDGGNSEPNANNSSEAESNEDTIVTEYFQIFKVNEE